MPHSIIIDWKRTLYDPESKNLINGSMELLEYVKKMNTPFILIGKGNEDMRKEVHRLMVEKYFTKIIFKEGKKETAQFKPFISEKNPKSTIVIGDRVKSEIELGNTLGATTLWVKQGTFSHEEPHKTQKPTHIVHSLAECLILLKIIWNEL